MATDPNNVVPFFGNVPKTKPEAAEFYAREKGWRVMPLWWMYDPDGNGKMRCACDRDGCPTPGKHPIVDLVDKEATKTAREQFVANGGDPDKAKEIKVHTATNDVAQVRRWWKKNPEANIGFWLAGSGLACLDVDVAKGKRGDVLLKELVKDAGMPDTLVCKTPSGGAHAYFLMREGVPNKENALGEGLDVWNGPHYTILPPSNHYSGGVYLWEKLVAPALYPDVLMPKPKKVGRPTGTATKETFDPASKYEVGKLLYDLAFVDAGERETWINVGIVMGRAFRRSPEGLQHYLEWAQTTQRGNYDEKLSRKAYEVDSQNPPSGSPLTTAYIHGLAAENQKWKPFDEASDKRERFDQRDGHLNDTLRDLNDVVVKAGVSVYQREGKMIEVVAISSMPEAERKALLATTGIDRPGSYCITREMSPGHFAVRVSEKVKWFRMYKGKYRLTDPDRVLCHDYLQAPYLWLGVPEFKAFAPHPTIRSLMDPTILSQSGYDTVSGLYLDTHLNLDIPTRLTPEQAREELRVLMSPFEQYKFTDPQGKAALFSLILTVGLRHAFDKAPMFLITAPVVGSGKTKMGECATALWYGEAAPAMVLTDNEEENEKRISGCAMMGDRAIFFDNISLDRALNDRTLSLLITTGRFQFRIMGGQDIARMAFPATIIGTGNNLMLGRDISRRTVKIDIDPEGPTPTGRHFDFDPVEYVKRHRPKLMRSALAIVAAYFYNLHLTPRQIALVPSFEAWSVVPDMSCWLGMPPPTLESNETSDVGDDYTGHASMTKRLMEILLDLDEVDLSKSTRLSKVVVLLNQRDDWKEWWNDAVAVLNYGKDREPRSDNVSSVGAVLFHYREQRLPGYGKLLILGKGRNAVRIDNE